MRRRTCSCTTSRDPAPTRGGPLCCGPSFVPGGSYDQQFIENRSDVLCYTTPPLAEDLEVTGPLTVTLFAATTGADTDFTAKLVDVEPCGAARALVDGIMRGRYRKGTDTAVPITPGAVEEYTIDLVATSNVFKAGHRVRLEISSSNFPRFDRNFNTGRRSLGGHRVRAGGADHHARRAVSVAAAASGHPGLVAPAPEFRTINGAIRLPGAGGGGRHGAADLHRVPVVGVAEPAGGACADGQRCGDGRIRKAELPRFTVEGLTGIAG